MVNLTPYPQTLHQLLCKFNKFEFCGGISLKDSAGCLSASPPRFEPICWSELWLMRAREGRTRKDNQVPINVQRAEDGRRTGGASGCASAAGTPTEAAQRLSYVPSASASHQPGDPAAPDASHPTGKDARMLKRWGKERGIHKFQLWGVWKGNRKYCGRAHQEHRRREHGYWFEQLGQNSYP